MTDTSWDGERPAPTRARRQRWSRWAFGCGIVLLFGAGLLAVGGNLIANRAFAKPEVRDPFVSKALWPQLRKLALELGTDEGARAVYARSPGLKDRYPGEQAFLAEVRNWRPSLAVLPETPPGPERLDIRLTFFGFRLRCRLPDDRTWLVDSRGRGKGHLPIVDLQLR